ncbi:MAG TPA: hypothetical protein VHM25_04020 [Polyangiaceae bacterium]|nr:hypothetical protein [Polyangiaceae bacterium]
MPSALASPSGIAVRARVSVAVAVLALTLPALAVKAWSAAYADSLGTGIAAWLIAVVPSLPAPIAPDGPGDPGEWGDRGDVEPRFEASPTLRAVAVDGKGSRHYARSRPAPKPKQGIRISSAQVLALASRRAMPSAVFVKASPGHPAGLLLAGVSALGVGLQDGDILTEAAGQRATSVAQIVGLVLAARSRQASEISGRFYRGGVPFSVTVEQPYPKERLPG